MENKRKCRVFDFKNRLSSEVFIFHKWVEEGAVERHPDDPQKDTTYVETYALIENCATGKVETEYPTRIKFID
jgi:hypothetical protein